MSRKTCEYRTASVEVYKRFCRENKDIEISSRDWSNIVRQYYCENIKYMLKTGLKVKIGNGFGVFAINKKKTPTSYMRDGKEHINLPIDWQKTKKHGKVIYNFNNHTDGNKMSWMWFRGNSTLYYSDLWSFRPSRSMSRSISQYIKENPEAYQLYQNWREPLHQD